MSRTCQTWSGFKVQGLQEPILILCLFRSIRWITRRIFRHVFPETVTCHTPTLKNDPQVETQDVPSCLARICGNENIHPPRRSAVPFSYPNLQSMPISTIWGSFVYTIFVMGGVSCATACTSASCESGGCGSSGCTSCGCERKLPNLPFVEFSAAPDTFQEMDEGSCSRKRLLLKHWFPAQVLEILKQSSSMEISCGAGSLRYW